MATDRSRGMKILVYSDICLAHDYRAGNINAFMGLLEWLGREHEVTVLYTHHRRPTRSLPSAVKLHWRPDYFNLAKRKLRARLGRPQRLLDFKRSWFKQWQFDRLLRRTSFDAVLIEYLDNSFLLESRALRPGVPRLCDLHDLMSMRAESFRRHGVETSENLAITPEEEMAAIARYDRVVVLQAREGAVIDEAVGRPITLTSRRTRVDIHPQTEPMRSLQQLRIGFIGTTTEFNVDAAQQLLTTLRLADPTVEYHVAGSVCDRLPPGMVGPDVRLHGVLESLDEFYAGIDVLANPIRFGSGLKTKNVEALAHGVPVITSTLGAEGLEDLCGEAIFVADTQAEFAAAVERIRHLGADGSLRQRIADLCRRTFDESAAYGPLKDYLDAAHRGQRIGTTP